MRNIFTRPTLPDYASITPDMFPRTMPATIASQSHLTSAPTKDLQAHLTNVVETSRAAVKTLDDEIALRQIAKAFHLKAIEAATVALDVIRLPKPVQASEKPFEIDEDQLSLDIQNALNAETAAVLSPVTGQPALPGRFAPGNRGALVGKAAAGVMP